MTSTVDTLEAEVLSLPKADRSRLLDRLVASLDRDDDVEAAWDAVAAEREAELDSGAVHGLPLDQALAQLEARHVG
jgi:hypothetical protein